MGTSSLARQRETVKDRVERDIASLNHKIADLERASRPNDPLLAAYRTMLENRTEVLECLLGATTAQRPAQRQ